MLGDWLQKSYPIALFAGFGLILFSLRGKTKEAGAYFPLSLCWIPASSKHYLTCLVRSKDKAYQLQVCVCWGVGKMKGGRWFLLIWSTSINVPLEGWDESLSTISTVSYISCMPLPRETCVCHMLGEMCLKITMYIYHTRGPSPVSVDQTKKCWLGIMWQEKNWLSELISR